MSEELFINGTNFSKNTNNHLYSKADVSNNYTDSVFNEKENSDIQNINISNDEADYLLDKLSDAEDNNGLITSVWDSFKGFVGLGSSSKKCEDAIDDFNQGKISFEEANEIIDSYSEKQENSLNLFANVATGVATVGIISSAFATGGLSLALVGALGVGALSKSGIKFLDRATNKIEDDALDKKQIAKDALSGALDGAVSVVTMGINPVSVGVSTVTKQSLKQTVTQGFISGAKSGTISGAVTGAGDYTINAALDEDVEFNASDLAKNTLTTAIAGGLTGGVFEGALSFVQYKSSYAKYLKRKEQFSDFDDDVIARLSDESIALKRSYTHNKEVSKKTKEIFGDVDSVAAITTRAKGDDSIFSKLGNKYDKNNLNPINHDTCFEAVADAYGSRVQLKSLSSDEASDIVNSFLSGSGYSFKDYSDFISGEKVSQDALEYFKNVNNDILNALKEKQTQAAVDALVQAIDNKGMVITELNNYGDDISSYFTNKQINEIADVYLKNFGKKLNIVTDISNMDLNGAKISLDDNGEIIYEFENLIFKNKKAIKPSGYASSQFNIVYDFNKVNKGLGELQIRGKELNAFADAEHIPYDIRNNKITSLDKEYKSVFDLIKSMSKESYDKYNEYLTSVYHAYRLNELGIKTDIPKIKGDFFTSAGDKITDSVVNLLSSDALINLKASIK